MSWLLSLWAFGNLANCSGNHIRGSAPNRHARFINAQFLDSSESATYQTCNDLPAV